MATVRFIEGVPPTRRDLPVIEQLMAKPNTWGLIGAYKSRSAANVTSQRLKKKWGTTDLRRRVTDVGIKGGDRRFHVYAMWTGERR